MSTHIHQLTKCGLLATISAMTGYTKLFEGLVRSSIWDEDDRTRLLWVTMLAIKNREHQVLGTMSWLAREARIPIEDCKLALEKFMSPDPESRTKDYEGRRIEQIAGGWVILNGEKYRNMLNVEERRAYKAAKQAEYRNRKKYVKKAGSCSGARQAVEEAIGSDDDEFTP